MTTPMTMSGPARNLDDQMTNFEPGAPAHVSANIVNIRETRA